MNAATVNIAAGVPALTANAPRSEGGPDEDKLQRIEVCHLDAVQGARGEDQHVAVELGRLEPQVDGECATRGTWPHAAQTAESAFSANSTGSRPPTRGMRTWFDPAMGRKPATVSARVTNARS